MAYPVLINETVNLSLKLQKLCSRHYNRWYKISAIIYVQLFKENNLNRLNCPDVSRVLHPTLAQTNDYKADVNCQMMTAERIVSAM